MTRFSLFRLGIVLSLVAGVVIAIYLVRNNQALTSFNYEIDKNRLMVSLIQLSDSLGEEKAHKIVGLKANSNTNLYYDGDARLAQVVKCRHQYDNDNSDICALYTFATGSVWFGPNGMRVESVRFNNDEILITIYGDLQVGSRSILIPENAPETYSIPWAANTNPSLGHFSDLIRVRHMDTQSEENRFYDLNGAATKELGLGNNEAARKLAEELMNLLPKFKDNWNYGNAVEGANLVLGRIAVIDGQLDDAKQFLIEAGRSPGSPQMNSFGPNMSLARDLLKHNETDIVLQYFELCRNFWKSDRGRLDRWSREVKEGKIPDFGANLRF